MGFFLNNNNVRLAEWLACPLMQQVAGSLPGRVIPKTIIQMAQSASLHGTQCVRVGVSVVQPDCLKGWEVCGTVYGDMHLKDILGSIARVGYFNPVPDSNLVLNAFRC